MSCTPQTVEVEDDGEDVWVPTSDCSLVQHWATKYEAEEKLEWTSNKTGRTMLTERNVKDVRSSVPGEEWKKGPTVWAVPSPTIGAYRDADLIQRLVSPASARDYQESRRNLSRAGYPDDVLDAVPTPR